MGKWGGCDEKEQWAGVFGRLSTKKYSKIRQNELEQGARRRAPEGGDPHLTPLTTFQLFQKKSPKNRAKKRGVQNLVERNSEENKKYLKYE